MPTALAERASDLANGTRDYCRRQLSANAAIASLARRCIAVRRSATTTTPCSAIRARNDGPI